LVLNPRGFRFTLNIADYEKKYFYFFPMATTVEDPISVKRDVSGALGTIGAKLSLGAFNLNADFTFGEYSTASASIFFRI
jgi:hypothetical protein